MDLHVALGIRSTKAGTVVPATELDISATAVLADRRSTKAGTVVPATGRSATRHHLPRSGPLNEGRDRSPGDRPSPTRVRPAPVATALNEGRDRSPGDSARTTCRTTPGSSLNEGRDRSPGDRRSACPSWGRSQSPLNEGRDRSPGDRFGSLRGRSTSLISLNEGRDRSPGDRPGRSTRTTSTSSLNEGRDRSPGDRVPGARGGRLAGGRSTKAGTVVPATAVILSVLLSGPRNIRN